ncbi:MAG: hypothetical protein Q7R64_04225 [bacterium]|nr:hypothetical protein [bacterium]
MSTINVTTLFGKGGNAFFLLYCFGRNFPGQSKDLHICFRAKPEAVKRYAERQWENQVELLPLHQDIKNNPWDAHRLIRYWLQTIFKTKVPDVFSRAVVPDRCFALQDEDIWSYNLVVPWENARGLYAQEVSDTLYLLPEFSEESLPHLFPQRTWLLNLAYKGFDHIRANMSSLLIHG